MKASLSNVTYKGGKGSGFYGHAGIPGHVGGSLPGIMTEAVASVDSIQNDVQASLQPSPGYADALIAKLKDRERQRRRFGTFLNSDADNAMYHLGFRGGSVEDYAMMERVEKATGDLEVALEVMGSQEHWAMNPAASEVEWAAAIALGGNTVLPNKAMAKTLPTLDEKHIAGYKARKQYVEDYVRAKYGEDIVLYRGIRGAQVSKLEDALYGKNPTGEHYIEPTMKLEDMKVGMRTLSSFTTSRWAASTFAKGKHGLVFKTTVHPKDVWMLTGLGVRSPIRFMEDNDEFVIFNTETERPAEIESWG